MIDKYYEHPCLDKTRVERACFLYGLPSAGAEYVITGPCECACQQYDTGRCRGRVPKYSRCICVGWETSAQRAAMLAKMRYAAEIH